MRILRGRKLDNGFLWVPVHYSHDIEGGKADPAWAIKARESFPRLSDWDKELEIDFALHVGQAAYPRYKDAKHLGITKYDTFRPIRLCWDFNIAPMSMIVVQKHEEIKQLHAITEFVFDGTIDDVCNAFRSNFPDHHSDILMYGDATKGTNAQTATSNWDVVKQGFRGYHIAPNYDKSIQGMANPRIGDRLNSVNHVLSGNGEYVLVIDSENCPELARDLREVVMTKDGKKILKSSDADDPYSRRTGPSDAIGYFLYREFPMIMETIRFTAKKRKPLVPGRLMGEVDQGAKWRQEQEKVQHRKRRPMDRSGAR